LQHAPANLPGHRSLPSAARPAGRYGHGRSVEYVVGTSTPS
jgi:hypothetical protein